MGTTAEKLSSNQETEVKVITNKNYGHQDTLHPGKGTSLGYTGV
jgi:hypothetical protein